MSSSFLWDRRFWSDPDFEGAGGFAKSLYVYFAGSMHTNLLGLFRASQHRIREETEFTDDQIRRGVSKLVEMRKMEVDTSANLYWIRAALKRERKLTQDRFFKGVVKEIFQMPDHPIRHSLLKLYEPILRAQKTDRCYTDADKGKLMALLEKFDDPSRAMHDPSMGPKAKAMAKAMDLNSSLSSEEESIANPGPTPTQGTLLAPPLPIEDVILAYWKERVQAKYGEHTTARAQTLSNIRGCLRAHDGRDLIASVARYGTKMDAAADAKGGGDPYPVVGSNFFGRAGHFAEYMPKPGDLVDARAKAEDVIRRLSAGAVDD